MIFTNPLQIVKFRLQVAGEMTQDTRTGTIGVIKMMGYAYSLLQGMYRIYVYMYILCMMC